MWVTASFGPKRFSSLECGRLRNFGVRLLKAFALCAAIPALAAPGDRDATFGTGGRVDPQFPGATEWRHGGMVIQTDGKIAVVGSCRVGTMNFFCVTRRLPNGDPDPGFGVQGAVITTDASYPGYPVMIVAQPGGQLVIAGTCGPSRPVRFCAIRLNDSGTRDTTFGTGGKVIITARMAEGFAGAFGARANGKLVFAGYCQPSDGSLATAVCAARIDADGELDPAFGVNGVALITVPSSVDDFDIVSVDMQSDGKIMITGWCRHSPPLSGTREACLFRLQGNGAVDNSYGNGGVLFALFPSVEVSQISAAVIQPDDSMLVAGNCGDYQFCVRRIRVDGSIVSLLPGNTDPDRYGGIRALHVQNDGKIVAAGLCQTSGLSPYPCWLRYNADGSIDSALPPVQERTISMGGSNAVAVQLDGKIIVSSSYYAGPNGLLRSSLIRYEGGPFGNSRCSLDVDGDGTVNPLIDGLILTRAVLGFTGPRVYAGVAFPSSATRTQWGTNGDNDIRKFLVSQCGMKLN